MSAYSTYKKMRRHCACHSLLLPVCKKNGVSPSAILRRSGSIVDYFNSKQLSSVSDLLGEEWTKNTDRRESRNAMGKLQYVVSVCCAV